MKYKINRDMTLKGKRYNEGDVVALLAGDSVRLLKKGLVSEVVEAPKPKKKEKKGDK